MATGEVNFDAWASGQVGSKLWLCRELERHLSLEKPLVVWIFGGWYAMTAFLLLSRERLPVEAIRSFDMDPDVTKTAAFVNDNWQWQNSQFEAFTTDCSEIDFSDLSPWSTRAPDLIINTSCEHFDSDQWWDNIPRGLTVALQSNNMKHDDHLFLMESEDELLERYPLEKVLFKGHLAFDYTDGSGFRRFMTIGQK